MDILDELECISPKTATEKVVEEISDTYVPGGRYALWITIRDREHVSEYRDRVDYIFQSSPFAGNYTCFDVQDTTEETFEYAGFSIPTLPLLTVMVMFDYNAINAGAVYHLIEKLRRAGIIDHQRDPHMIYIPEQYTYNYMFRSMTLCVANQEQMLSFCDSTTFKYLDVCKAMVRDYYEEHNLVFRPSDDVRIKNDIDYLKMWNESYKPLYQQHAKYTDGKIDYWFSVTDPFYHSSCEFHLYGCDLHELYVRFGIFTNVLSNFIYFSHKEEMSYGFDPMSSPVYVPEQYIVSGFNPQALIFKMSRGGRIEYQENYELYDFEPAIVDLLQKYTQYKEQYQTEIPFDTRGARAEADMKFLSDYINNIDINNFKKDNDNGSVG